ncbi:MAG TPA: benzoylformate decarboxylase [Solirubrobacterales bacterium]|jgi:benzoylformate decarboxylase|nr:benzoylformate decarboxylase [Solirubrobacterales bacterium]
MTTVHDAAYEVLRSFGMTTVFGNPGSNELTFLDEFPDDFRYVLALQEGAGLAMADAYSQATDRPVLVSLHAAAGVGQAMGALVNSQLSGTPLVILSGQQARSLVTLEGQLTNVDAINLPKPLVKGSFEASSPATVPATLARAVHLATSAPTGPVFVSVPLDDWRAEAGDDVEGLVRRRVTARPEPQAAAIAALAERLDRAENPLLIFGADVDAYGGWDAGVELAERLQAPALLAIEVGRISFPTDHPCYQGTLGVTIEMVREQLQGHDLVLVAGAPVFRYHAWAEGPYLPAGTELVALTADPSQAARAPVGDAIVGDPAAALAMLATQVATGDRTAPPRPDLPPADRSAVPLQPEALLEVLRDRVPADAVFASEVPSLGNWWERVPITRPRSFFSSAAGALGYGIGAAVGLGLADPDRPVVCLSGDGSAHYGITGLWSAAQHEVDATFVIARNGAYGALKEFGGFLETSGLPGTDLPGLDFVALATGYGVEARRAETASELDAALAAAFASRGPNLIEVATEPHPSGMFGG